MDIKPRHSGRFGNQTPNSPLQPVVNDEVEVAETPEETSEQSGVSVDAQDVSVDSTVTESPGADVETPDEIDESKFLEFYRKRTGRDISDFSELEKPDEPHSPSSDYDEEIQRFLQFQKVKGGTMQDWLELNKDWKEIDDIDMLRAQMKEEYGSNLSKSEIDALIKDKYGIDEMDEFSDLEGVQLAKLKADANKYRKQKISSQEEVLKSLDDTDNQEEDSQPDSEMVTLSNGMKVNKQDYLNQRREYEESRAAAIESLNQTSFSFKMKTQDGEKEVKLDYSYTNEDKQKMLSKSQDTGRLLEDFIDENKKLKHGEFNEGLLWADKKHRETVLIPRLLAQAFSMGIDNEVAEERNVNFDVNRPVSQGVKARQIDTSKLPGRQAFGPRFSFNKKKN